jgi:hypothetical protein
MKPKQPKRDPQAQKAHYMKLNRQRATAAYQRFIAQQEGNVEKVQELDKLWHDLNDEIEELEREGAKV